ncbi:ThuA domain-containing protein [Mucilaginibacter sp. BJC16-A38]|uniref:ThuA domain-containing protein n=1 Tax=Mucilaginibacter phenanthrenivorans TaxID=1234842 RepID=UPI0021575BC3|nr:ThuA domain-containing protein [Mucilaginibacter phenanthrenivorans]MCR8556687.1 ThuA domain-containing protein [Mucilaginibacter phenanthrenivorans]
MKHILFIFAMLCMFISAAMAKQKVLIFSKTAGFHHNSIAVGIPAILKLGQENNFDADTTTDGAKFTFDNLKQYAAVIFLSTTGDVLNETQQAAFEKYIRNGGGFVGVHSATDTEYDWPWYGNLVGAYFKIHPAQQFAVLHVVDRNFIATKHLPADWHRFDEWYNFKWIAPNLHVLIKIDEKTYTGGLNGDDHPMAWYHDYDGGRAFYTELGHTDESYADPLYLKHLLGGIEYAMGNAGK